VRLVSGDYTLLFKDGGVEVHRDGKMLYCNRRPMFVTVKTVFAVNEFYDGAYDDVAEDGGRVVAGGVLTVPSGSMFAFMDTYEAAGTGFKVSRRVKVLRAADDLGFSTKISFVMAESDDPRDYWCFAPGVWYKQNEFAPDTVIGKDLDCEYFWRMETCYALPLFAMQHTRSGETASLSRWAADVTMPSTDILRAENHTDPKCTTGAIGMSRPESLTLNYMYYGFPVRNRSRQRSTVCQSITCTPAATVSCPPGIGSSGWITAGKRNHSGASTIRSLTGSSSITPWPSNSAATTASSA